MRWSRPTSSRSTAHHRRSETAAGGERARGAHAREQRAPWRMQARCACKVRMQRVHAHERRARRGVTVEATGRRGAIIHFGTMELAPFRRFDWLLDRRVITTCQVGHDESQVALAPIEQGPSTEMPTIERRAWIARRAAERVHAASGRLDRDAPPHSALMRMHSLHAHLACAPRCSPACAFRSVFLSRNSGSPWLRAVASLAARCCPCPSGSVTLLAR